ASGPSRNERGRGEPPWGPTRLPASDAPTVPGTNGTRAARSDAPPLAGSAEGSEVEDHIRPDRQGVRDGLVAAGIDEVLEARLHEQAGFDGASVSPLQGHLPALHADGGVGQGLNLLRAAQVAAVRAVSQPETGEIAGTARQEAVSHSPASKK